MALLQTSDAEDLTGYEDTLFEDIPADASITSDEGTEPGNLGLEDWPEDHPAQNPQNGSEQQRYQYWQSQADKNKAELEKYKQQLAEVQPFVPVARYLQDNPQVINGLQTFFQGGERPDAGLAAQQVPQQPPVPSAPVEPVRPATYNALDLDDPNSETSKYEQALKSYERSLTKYEIEQLRKEREEFASFKNSQIEEYRKTQANQQLQQYLGQKYQFNAEMTQQFIAEMDDPKTLELDALVDYWNYKRNKGKQPVQQVQKQAQAFQNQRPQNQRPTSIAAIPAAETMFNEDDMFNAALLQSGKRF